MTKDLGPESVAEITAIVDIQAASPDDQPSALFLFGSNQAPPAEIAAHRYHAGLAPLIITTGGVNRHNGIIEGQVFQRRLIELGVPPEAIRREDRSANTWQNVEYAPPFLEEARQRGLPITVMSKWYHRRTVHILKTVFPEIGAFSAMGWEPIYDDRSVTQADWPAVPGGRRRVIREWEELSRRLKDGSFMPLERGDATWQ